MPEQSQYLGRAVPGYVSIPSVNLIYKEQKKPYEYSYFVKDDYYGIDFDAAESSDGKSVKGHYGVLLPDGRRQQVKYTAGDYTGYNAEVSYDGGAATYHISKFNDMPKKVIISAQKTEPITSKQISYSLAKPRDQDYETSSPAILSTTKIMKEETSLEPKRDQTNPPKMPKLKYGYKILRNKGSLGNEIYPTIYKSEV